MRIVGGDWRGRSLKAPSGRNTRPTADRVQESIFNILAHGRLSLTVHGTHVLDVFAGTGGLAFEAMSRGAAHATFIENDRSAIQTIQHNAGVLGVARTVVILPLDGARLPSPPMKAKAPFDVVFLDAPYDQGLTQPALLGLINKGWLAAEAVLVVETGTHENIVIPSIYEQIDERSFGAAKVTFLRLKPSSRSSTAK